MVTARKTVVNRLNGSKKKQEEVITIHPIELGLIKIRLEGKASYMSSAFTDEKIQVIMDKASGAASSIKGQKKLRDFAQEFKETMYVMPNKKWNENALKKPNGTFCFKSRAIEQAFVSSCRHISTKKMSEHKGVINITQEFIPFTKYKNITRRFQGVPCGGNKGGTTVCVYAEIIDWECELSLEYNKNRMGAEEIINMLDLAGFHVGIGSRRPENGGRFGTFRVIPLAMKK